MSTHIPCVSKKIAKEKNRRMVEKWMARANETNKLGGGGESGSMMSSSGVFYLARY